MSGIKFRVFAISAVIAINATNSVASLPKYLSKTEMAEIRGTSAMACQGQLTCNQFNLSYSDFSCAGKPDNTLCKTCEHSELKVDVVAMTGEIPGCTGGWKTYSGSTPPTVNCGKKYELTYCENGVCKKAGTTTRDCNVPAVITEQPH